MKQTYGCCSFHISPFIMPMPKPKRVIGQISFSHTHLKELVIAEYTMKKTKCKPTIINAKAKSLMPSFFFSFFNRAYAPVTAKISESDKVITALRKPIEVTPPKMNPSPVLAVMLNHLNTLLIQIPAK